MQTANRPRPNIPSLCTAIAAVAALILALRVQNQPLVFGPWVRIDSLSAFFMFVIAIGCACSLLFQQDSTPIWHIAAIGVALTIALTTPLVLVIAGCFAVGALLTQSNSLWNAVLSTHTTGSHRLAALARRSLRIAAIVLAPLCLLVGYSALALRGAARYDAPGADFTLASFEFWFVLLAAAIPLLHLDASKTNVNPVFDIVVRFAWLYPLMRLFSFGPWNTGWSFATMLFGSAVAGWYALGAIARPNAHPDTIASALLAFALAALGPATSAGVAAACYTGLAAVVVSNRPGSEQTFDANPSRVDSLSHWLLTPAFPFSAPFVALWMVAGAGIAGGIALLSGIAWLAALLLSLSVVWYESSSPARRPRQVRAALSFLLGIGAPLIMVWLVQPVVAQLQGGLTPYGEINVWPWVGLAAGDAAHTQVTTLPSIAIALLMLVLCALVYIVAQLRRNSKPQPDIYADSPSNERDVFDKLRADVPWLDLLRGAAGRSERPHGDAD